MFKTCLDYLDFKEAHKGKQFRITEWDMVHNCYVSYVAEFSSKQEAEEHIEYFGQVTEVSTEVTNHPH